MTIKPIEEHKAARSIDLTGPQGNSWVLLGLARRLAGELDKDGDKIIERMKSADYENLIKVFDEEFGEIYTLYR